MDKSVYAEMFRLESQHWWFSAKRQIVLTLLCKHIRNDSQAKPRVVDIGCGCGMMLVDLARNGFDGLGLDASDEALAACRDHGVIVAKCIFPQAIPVSSESCDAVLLLDFLEHIDDDLIALQQATRLLKPGGIAICTVPAHPWLWTAGDEWLHHRRRYTRQTLLALVSSSPSCSVVLLSYMFSTVFPLAVVSRLALKLWPERARSAQLSIPPLGLNRPLRMLSAWERHLLKLKIPMPLGLSLVAVVRKLG